MSYLLESLGRGLLARLADAFASRLPQGAADAAELAARLRQCPTSADLAVQLGARYLGDGEPHRARTAFARALELCPENAVARLGLACALDELDDIAAAIAELQRVHRDDPADPAVCFALGMCCERLAQAGAAHAWYALAARRCASLRNAYERMAALALRRGDAVAAITQYQTLAGLTGNDADVLHTLGALQLRAGAARDAIASFQRALLIEPEAHDAPVLDARPQTRADVLASTYQLEALVEANPAASEYRVHLGDLYVKLGEDERAVSQYEAALQLHPTLLEATVKLGTQHLRRQRYLAAAEAFNYAVELNDRMLMGFVALGAAQFAAGAGPDAEATFGLAVSLAPNSTLLFSEALRLRLKAQREARFGHDFDEEQAEAPGEHALLDEAAGRCEHVLLRRGADAGLHYRRGLLARQLGAFHDSLSAFRRAAELNPAFAKAQIQLGVALWEAGERAAGRAAFERALSCSPAEIEQHYELALLFTRRTRFDQALEHLADALPDDGQRSAAEETITLALQNVGLLDRPAAGWQSISELLDPALDRGACSDA